VKQGKLITFFSILLFCCILLSTGISLFSMRQLSQEHAEQFLRTSARDIYRSVGDVLSEAVHVSEAMSNDTLLSDLLENEDTIAPDEMAYKLSAHSNRICDAFSYSWVFVVSDRSKAYYSGMGMYDYLDLVNEPGDSWYAEFVESGKDYAVSSWRNPDDPEDWYIFVDSRIENVQGEFLGVCGVALDVADLQEQIHSYEEAYGVDVVFVDADGQVQINGGTQSVSSCDPDILPDKNSDDKFTLTKDSSWKNTSYTVSKYLKELDWYIIINNFQPYDYNVDYVLIGLNIAAFLIIMLITGICLRKISKKSAHFLVNSYTDKLTGISNRRAFSEKITNLKKCSSLENIVIIACDIDGLKQINDALGHSAGDELIKGAAQIIQEICGPYGECYRTGGDEFVAILEKPVESIADLGVSLEQEICAWKGSLVEKMHISYGISQGSEQADLSIDELICIADERMYQRKREYYSSRRNNRRWQKFG
jgi:diguanylate cyclase (GGDEF)-like protein